MSQVNDLKESSKAAQAPQAAPNGWPELCRRLYVELFHCDQQMMQARDAEGEPVWDQGIAVANVLADAKAALEAAPDDALPTESVLIAGSTYDVPAPVAAELLRLHMELEEGDEPVAAQNRFRSHRWTECTVAHARSVMAEPSVDRQSGEYEVRLLYTRPNAPSKSRPQMNLLAEIERHAKAHIIEIENLLSRRF